MLSFLVTLLFFCSVNCTAWLLLTFAVRPFERPSVAMRLPGFLRFLRGAAPGRASSTSGPRAFTRSLLTRDCFSGCSSWSMCSPAVWPSTQFQPQPAPQFQHQHQQQQRHSTGASDPGVANVARQKLRRRAFKAYNDKSAISHGASDLELEPLVLATHS